MCKICVDYTLGHLTAKEAIRNASEVVQALSIHDERYPHMVEVMDKMADKVIEENHDLPRWVTDGGKDGV